MRAVPRNCTRQIHSWQVGNRWQKSRWIREQAPCVVLTSVACSLASKVETVRIWLSKGVWSFYWLADVHVCLTTKCSKESSEKAILRKNYYHQMITSKICLLLRKKILDKSLTTLKRPSNHKQIWNLDSPTFSRCPCGLFTLPEALKCVEDWSPHPKSPTSVGLSLNHRLLIGQLSPWSHSEVEVGCSLHKYVLWDFRRWG